jgi:hypothetical protein
MKRYELQAFRTRWNANEYRKFQGWTTRYAKVRMFHWPEHPFANKAGNVAVLKLDTGVSGDRYLFSNGEIWPLSFHGTLNA